MQFKKAVSYQGQYILQLLYSVLIYNSANFFTPVIYRCFRCICKPNLKQNITLNNCRHVLNFENVLLSPAIDETFSFWTATSRRHADVFRTPSSFFQCKSRKILFQKLIRNYNLCGFYYGGVSLHTYNLKPVYNNYFEWNQKVFLGTTNNWRCTLIIVLQNVQPYFSIFLMQALLFKTQSSATFLPCKKIKNFLKRNGSCIQ